MNLAGALLLLLSLAHMDKLGHEGLESTERGVWSGSGFRAGLHPRPLYLGSQPWPTVLFRCVQNAAQRSMSKKDRR